MGYNKPYCHFAYDAVALVAVAIFCTALFVMEARRLYHQDRRHRKNLKRQQDALTLQESEINVLTETVVDLTENWRIDETEITREEKPLACRWCAPLQAQDGCVDVPVVEKKGTCRTRPL